MKDIHDQLVDLAQRVAALEAYPPNRPPKEVVKKPATKWAMPPAGTKKLGPFSWDARAPEAARRLDRATVRDY